MLSLYRRHLRTCSAGHKEEARTSAFEERKKGFKRCECPIFASGTMAGKSKRQNTGQWEWEPAKLIATKWEAIGNWDSFHQASPPPAVASKLEPETQPSTTIADATEAFLATCQNRGIQ